MSLTLEQQKRMMTELPDELYSIMAPQDSPEEVEKISGIKGDYIAGLRKIYKAPVEPFLAKMKDAGALREMITNYMRGLQLCLGVYKYARPAEKSSSFN